MNTVRALIYTRISRDDSGQGAANERQETECRRLAEYRGWDIIDVESDISFSASSGKRRPAWNRVLERIEAKEIDVVVAWHFDRMTRTMADLEDLINLSVDNGVGISTVTGDIDLNTDTGRMIARILAAVARGEVERKSERQRSANRQRASAGVPWPSGFRAFGYELNGVVIDVEAAAIREAASDALAGESMKEIARRWDAAGHRSVHAKAGNPGWTGRGIRSMLVSPRYAGIATYKGEAIGVGNWVPILSEDTHLSLRAKLRDSTRRTRNGGGRSPEHLLSGIATCARCHETVTARTANGVAAYGCTRGCVGTFRVDADMYVSDIFARAVRAFGPGLATGAATSNDDQVPMSIDGLLEEKRRHTKAFLAGGLDDAEFDAAVLEIESRMQGVEVKVARTMARSYSPTHGASELVADFEAATLASRRDLIKRCLDISLVAKGRGKRGVPISEQVVVHITVGEESIPLAGLLAMEVPA